MQKTCHQPSIDDQPRCWDPFWLQYPYRPAVQVRHNRNRSTQPATGREKRQIDQQDQNVVKCRAGISPGMKAPVSRRSIALGPT